MKIIKKIITGLFVLFLLYCFISAFIPSKVRVQRSVLINAPAGLIYEQVNSFKNWAAWSYWETIDPQMKSTYEGPGSGTGAVHKWSSRNRDVDSGSISITASKPDSVLTDLDFGGMTGHGGWAIRDTVEGARVTTWIDMNMSFFGRIFPGLMMDKFIGDDFEKTLLGLKKHAELLKLSHPAPMVQELITKDQVLASYRTVTDMKRIAADIALSYQKIGKFMAANGLRQTGPVCAFYHGYSGDRIDMECAIPVNKEVKSSDEVHVNLFKAENAVELDYYGPYMGTSKAHAYIGEWITKHHKKISGSPWEVYVTDPAEEKDTAKWLTKIYYPVE